MRNELCRLIECMTGAVGICIREHSIDITGSSSFEKHVLMLGLIMNLEAKLVYEIGFNTGTMAAPVCALLEERGGQFVGFEILETLKPIVDLFVAEFPNTFKMIWGNSAETLPAFGGTPDIVFVDGDHSYNGAIIDMKNALTLLRPGGLLVIDDSCDDTLCKAIKDTLPESETVWLPFPTGIVIHQKNNNNQRGKTVKKKTVET